MKLNVEETIRQLTNLKCEEGPVSRQEFADVIDLAVAALKRMERQEQDRWIPVSEALPKEKAEYLVTYHPCYWDDVETDIKIGIDSFRGKTTCAKHKYQRVIAFRPLPKPYQEDEA